MKAGGQSLRCFGERGKTRGGLTILGWRAESCALRAGVPWRDPWLLNVGAFNDLAKLDPDDLGGNGLIGPRCQVPCGVVFHHVPFGLFDGDEKCGGAPSRFGREMGS